MEKTTYHTSHTSVEDEYALKSTELDTVVNVLPPPGSSGIKLSREFVQFLMDRKEVNNLDRYSTKRTLTFRWLSSPPTKF